jgi:hypothetical protein
MLIKRYRDFRPLQFPIQNQNFILRNIKKGLLNLYKKVKLLAWGAHFLIAKY